MAVGGSENKKCLVLFVSCFLMSSLSFICAMVKSRYSGDGHPTFNRNPYNGHINPYYWVDDHPLLYGNNGSLDPGTYTVSIPYAGIVLDDDIPYTQPG